MSDGRIAITLVGQRSGKPDCATYDYWFVADENSTAGKAQYSLLLAALASGKPVLLAGTGSCTRWTDGENINGVMMAK